ncbi:hypothetical protein [Streptomyces lavendofoliae]|uniref:Uncharacterized protein n=1 Tax=Streptomyces lavendofoliae TaxID=67314 RepID=A0A918I2J8_9ACTN|nr:hypothetical protein [Streptomyces lavendofoliae]GGU62416.1 hypothetical protein GCM10010274_59000 [Streptomyces lavendofoliae]
MTTPAEEVRAAEERVRMGGRRIDIALRGPLAELLDDLAVGDDEGEINPYALDLARALNRSSQ